MKFLILVKMKNLARIMKLKLIIVYIIKIKMMTKIMMEIEMEEELLLIQDIMTIIIMKIVI